MLIEKYSKQSVIKLSRSGSCFDFYESLSSSEAIKNPKITLKPVPLDEIKIDAGLNNQFLNRKKSHIEKSSTKFCKEKVSNKITQPTPNFKSMKPNKLDKEIGYKTLKLKKDGKKLNLDKKQLNNNNEVIVKSEAADTPQFINSK
jgi:hypothetical protein